MNHQSVQIKELGISQMALLCKKEQTNPQVKELTDLAKMMHHMDRLDSVSLS